MMRLRMISLRSKVTIHVLRAIVVVNVVLYPFNKNWHARILYFLKKIYLYTFHTSHTYSINLHTWNCQQDVRFCLTSFLFKKRYKKIILQFWESSRSQTIQCIFGLLYSYRSSLYNIDFEILPDINFDVKWQPAL